MRTLIIILLILVVVIGGGYFYLSQNVDTIVEAAIEQGGSDATMSNVIVDDVTISFEEGSGTLTGLRVANPSGFSDDNAISLDGIKLVIDPGKSQCSITGCKLIHVTELTVERPVIAYEVGVGKSNIAAIRENVERYSGGGSGKAPSDSGTKFVVEKLRVTQGEIKVQSKVGRLVSSDLPGIAKDNLGVGSGGISGAEIGEILVGELASNASMVVTEGALSGILENPLGEDGVIGGVKRGIGGMFGGDN